MSDQGSFEGRTSEILCEFLEAAVHTALRGKGVSSRRRAAVLHPPNDASSMTEENSDSESNSTQTKRN